jgi:RNA polymerase sigma factor (sigma-70 family)
MNDEVLILQIKSGDQKALAELYTNHRSEFLRWIMKDFKCPDDESKDIFQVAVLVVYENIQRGKLDQLTSSLKTYLFGVGKNLAREWSRKNQRNLPFEPDLHLQELALEDSDIDLLDNKLDVLSACLQKMGAPCRELLELFYFNRKSMEEISLSLGYKNTDSAKNQKYKCMGRLRKFYEEDFAKQLT